MTDERSLRVRKNAARFVQKAREIHGDVYQYSTGEYFGARIKTPITCYIHGVFYQRPSDHLSGSRCPKCYGKGYSGEEMIAMLTEIHGDRYDLSCAEYKGSNGQLKIRCRIHGVFEVSYNAFKRGSNCPKCSSISRKRKISVSKAEFIRKAVDKHGEGRYDYSGMKYLGFRKRTSVVCRDHGEFKITPLSHLNKNGGCPECAKEILSNRRRLSTPEFIERALQVHGDTYDYSKVEYNLTTIPVVIGCPKHGDFTIAPHDHLKGSGCQECSREGLAYSWMKEDYCAKFPLTNLYLIKFHSAHFSALKVGISTEPETRARDICKSVKCKHTTLFVIQGSSEILWEFEKAVHTDPTLESHSWGELTFGGYTEFYSAAEEERLLRMFASLEESLSEEPK